MGAWLEIGVIGGGLVVCGGKGVAWVQGYSRGEAVWWRLRNGVVYDKLAAARG